MLRRDIIKTIGMGTLAMGAFPGISAAGLMDVKQTDRSRIPIGLCNHSLRGMKLNARRLIDYAAEANLDSVLLNTFQPFDSLDKKHLTALRKMADQNGVSIYTGAGSISETSTKFNDKYGKPRELLLEGIRVASLVGSPVVGVRIGAIQERYLDGGIQAHIDAVVKVMRSVRTQALDAGVKFAFENHAGDLRSKELLGLINATGTDICGALYDPANAVWALEDPMIALNVLGENIICTSVRDVAVWETSGGISFQGMAIGEGMLDFRKYAHTMANLCPGVPLHIETISNSARPVPFLMPGFLDGFPDLKVADIAELLRLAKKGKPQKTVRPPAGIDRKMFDIDQQQYELKKSIKYLRENCNAGLKQV